MLQNLNDVSFLVGKIDNLNRIKSVPVLSVFDKNVIGFLADLSTLLLRNSKAKQYSDIMALAFWIRRASIESIAKKYEDEERLGRGVVFHIAPSNIPVQFAVSLVYALTAGNASIIRVSDKKYEQVDILCDNINELLEQKYNVLIPYINVIRYEHNNEITTEISEICDARIIWGGNNTVEIIGKISIPPRAIELKFADRFSIMIIDADKYLKMESTIIANDFYLDTFLVDQNACSSPRLIVWLGTRVAEAQKVFWHSIQKMVEERYEYKDISGSEKLLRFTLLAAKDKEIRLVKENNKLFRVELRRLYPELFEYKGNCGYFFEYEANDCKDILPILSKECQTIICCGVDKNYIRHLIIENGVYGGDRVVDIGHALDLSFIWDGYDMIRELSRVIL